MGRCQKIGKQDEILLQELQRWLEERRLYHRKDGEVVPCRVDVFALEVREQRRSWAEKAARDFRWCPVEEALARVGEPGLRQVIAHFAETMRVALH